MNARVQAAIDQGNPWYIQEQLASLDSPSQRNVLGRRWCFFDRILRARLERSAPPLTVLDAGCGDGVNLSFLSRIPGLKISAFDYNPLRVKRASVRFPEIPVQQMDPLGPNDGVGLYDVILLSQVLEHIEDDVLVLSNLRNMLSFGGTLILGVPNEGCLMARLRNKVFEPEISRTTDHVHFYTPDEILGKINQAGFRVADRMLEGFFSPRTKLHAFMNSDPFRFKVMQFLGRLMPSQTAGYYFALEPR